MNRRTLLLALLFIALGAGAWYAWNKRKNQSGTRNSPDMEFAVKNTDDIGKIFIADRSGQTATLERKEGYWLYNGRYRARKSAIETLLETIQKVNVLNKLFERVILHVAQEHLALGAADRHGQD